LVPVLNASKGKCFGNGILEDFKQEKHWRHGVLVLRAEGLQKIKWARK